MAKAVVKVRVSKAGAAEVAEGLAEVVKEVEERAGVRAAAARDAGLEVEAKVAG